MIIIKGTTVLKSKPLIAGKGLNRKTVKVESNETETTAPKMLYEQKTIPSRIPNDPTKRYDSVDIPTMGRGLSNVLKDMSALNFSARRKKKGVVLKLG